MNSTQQNEVNGGTPLAEPLGSAVDGVKCEDCGQLPELVRDCGQNECAWRLECKCGGKGFEFVRSPTMAILRWESEGFKKQNAQFQGRTAPETAGSQGGQHGSND